MRVVWTDRAKQRLRELQAYIAEDAPLVAPRIAKRILLRSRDLQRMPTIGRRVPEFERDDVRELLVQPYRIIYLLLTDRIDVLTVRHYRQLMPSDLKDI